MKLKLPVSRFPRQFNPTILEMIDRPEIDRSILVGELKNLRKINQWFGTHRMLRREIELFMSKNKLQALSILDLCTGSADNPQAIVDWYRQSQIPIRITATDINSNILEQAKHECVGYPEICFEKINALAPPYPDLQFDVVMCNLALHHFTVEDAVQILKQMWRLTRGMILMSDLHRSRIISVLTQIFIPLWTSNSMTRFDANLSVQRAFTWDELLRLAFQAKIPNPKINRYSPIHQVLTANK